MKKPGCIISTSVAVLLLPTIAKAWSGGGHQVMATEAYTKTAKAVAEKQAALAGYRLADEIQEYVR